MSSIEQTTLNLAENGGRLEFENFDEVQAWLAKELETWRWLNPSDEPGHALGQKLYQRFSGTLNQCRQNVSNWHRGTKPDTHQVSLIEKEFREWKLVASHSQIGLTIFEIRDSEGEAAGRGATAAAIPNFVSEAASSPSEHLKGAMLLLLHRIGDLSSTPKTVREHLSRIREDYTQNLVEDTRAFDSLRKRFQGQIKASDEALASMQKRESDLYEKLEKTHHEMVGEAESELKAIQNQYNEFMKLKSPVTYWEIKSQEHNARKSKYQWVLMIYIIFILTIFTYIGIGYFSTIFSELVAASAGLSAPIFLVGGLIATTFTILFWIARVLVRLFLSEHHLAIDASQRATMAQTYLALIDENGADPDSRTIVLSALFRPATDGIVSDDAAPSFGLPAFLSGQASR